MHRETKKVANSFDQIIKVGRSIAKKWEFQALPLVVIEEILSKAKLNPDSLKNPEKAVIVFQEAYNKMLDSILKEMKHQAKSMGTDRVPVENFEHAVNIVKESFIQGTK